MWKTCKEADRERKVSGSEKVGKAEDIPGKGDIAGSRG